MQVKTEVTLVLADGKEVKLSMVEARALHAELSKLFPQQSQLDSILNRKFGEGPKWLNPYASGECKVT